MFEYLSRNRKLRSLLLDMEGCKYLSEKNISSLSDCLSKYSFLRSLNLNIGLCKKIDDSCINNLARGILGLEDLKELHLNIRYSQSIKDEAVGKLISSLSKHSLSLIHFELNMSDCKKLSDLSVQNLGNVVSKMKYLEKLELYLSRCPKVTVKGLSQMMESIDVLEKVIDANCL